MRLIGRSNDSCPEAVLRDVVSVLVEGMLWAGGNVEGRVAHSRPLFLERKLLQIDAFISYLLSGKMFGLYSQF